MKYIIYLGAGEFVASKDNTSYCWNPRIAYKFETKEEAQKLIDSMILSEKTYAEIQEEVK